MYDKIGTYETIEATSSATHPTPRTGVPTPEKTSSKDKICKGASKVDEEGKNMATTADGVGQSCESSKKSPPVHTSGVEERSEDAEPTDPVHKTMPKLHEKLEPYEQVTTEYDREGTYETVGNVYDKICTYETVGNVYDNSLVPKL